jgi:hypothetical protein
VTRREHTTSKLQPVGDVEILAQWAWMRVGSVLVLCTIGEREPPETDLDAWLMRAARDDYTKILLHSRGGSPDAKQRARLAGYWDKAAGPIPPCAVLTDSAMVRSVLVALSWISKFPMRAFAGDDVAGALRFLEEPDALDAVRDTIETLHRALAVKSRSA